MLPSVLRLLVSTGRGSSDKELVLFLDAVPYKNNKAENTSRRKNGQRSFGSVIEVAGRNLGPLVEMYVPYRSLPQLGWANSTSCVSDGGRAQAASGRRLLSMKRCL